LTVNSCVRIATIYVLSIFAAAPGSAQNQVSSPVPVPSPQIEAALNSPADLPNAPAPQSTPAPNGTSAQGAPANQGEAQQTKRILYIVPNFRAVTTGTQLPKQSVKEKFKTAAQDSFDYSSFIFAGMQAGIAQATNSYPAFRQGAAGYGRYYWHTFADQADENLWVEGVLPVVLRQDSRYYTLGHGGILKRGVYAVSRIVITRTDSGGRAFNASEVFGAGTASAISAAYYPSQYQTWTKVGQRWLTNVLLDAGTFGAKEFWPDVNRLVFHQTD
jgi:hypothetical protein